MSGEAMNRSTLVGGIILLLIGVGLAAVQALISGSISIILGLILLGVGASRNRGTPERTAPVIQASEAPVANPMKEMVLSMATMPEDGMQSMLSDRLQLFASATESDRKKMMKMMLDAALDLPEESYRKLASARMRALMSLPDESKMALLKTQAAIVKLLSPEKMQKEMRVMQQLLSGMPEPQRSRMLNMMKNAGFPTPGM